jgi:hypothetical protein
MEPGQGAAAGRAVLRNIQNEDGGWGYRVNSESRVEPTCWAMRALSADLKADPVVLSKARTFLLKTQNKDGSWPATPEMQSGNWVTSLACAVLCNQPDAQSATAAGLAWLCADYPLDSSPLLRLIRRLRQDSKISEMSDSSRGWGWTPRTSSWVEPTAFALFALRECPSPRLPANAEDRRDLAVQLIYDRMCPGGGWNCGNPRVYGVAGEPLVLPTAWALLALHGFPHHESKTLSLFWLHAQVPNIVSAGSLAAATICLETYARPVPVARIQLQDVLIEQLLEEGVHVLAWVCLALSADRSWPRDTGVAA